MVGDIIRRRGGQDDRRLDPPQSLGDPPPRFVVIEDRQVAEFETEIFRPDQLADARASSRRIVAIASASCSALPQSPGVIVAIVT